MLRPFSAQIFPHSTMSNIYTENDFQTHFHANIAGKYYPQYAAQGYSHNKHMFSCSNIHASDFKLT